MGAPDQKMADGGERLLIFDWPRRTPIRWGGWLALLLVAGLFVMLVVVVRVRVMPPVAWGAPQAAVIYMGGDSEVGQLYVRRARAQGPFPSRFEPSAWRGLAKSERDVIEATRVPREPYQPELRPFPRADEVAATPLALRGEPVLPERILGPLDDPRIGPLVVVPVVAPVSGWRDEDLVRPLPEFTAEVGEATAAQSWRFMLHVDGAGRVRECVSLAGAGDPGVAAVAGWLKRLVFAGGERWLSLSVEFMNQVVDDGAGVE